MRGPARVELHQGKFPWLHLAQHMAKNYTNSIDMSTPKGVDGQVDASSLEMMQPGLAEAARVLLESIPAENPSRDGFVRTPGRFAKAMAFILQGYNQKVSEVVSPDAIFNDGHSEPVVVKDISIFSLCEHHLLPFYGKVHVTYMPRDGKIVGLSKLARLAEVFSRRLQVQERLTRQIADALEESLGPLGVGVIVECTHLCMSMRGVRSIDSSTLTSARRGCFEGNDKLWRDFWGQVLHISDIPPSLPVTKNTITRTPCARNNRITCCLCSDSDQIHEANQELPTVVSSEADDYRLYTKCADEFDTMSQIIKDSCFGKIVDNEAGGFSMLDVGAGTGHVLKTLVSPSVNVVPSRYVAFEPDADALKDLNKVLQSSGCKLISSEIKNDIFDQSITVEEIGGPFDIVLLSHVLYTITKVQAEQMFNHSLQFVAPGGVLLIFHHSSSGKVDAVRKYMIKERMMFHQQEYSVKVDVTNLTTTEIARIENYTKSRSRNGSIYRSVCVIAVESSNSHPIQGEEMNHIIRTRKVSYAARAATPAAICTPNSVVGIQACLHAASEKKFGFDSVSVIGGGHSANCIANDALAINMRGWKKIKVHPEEMMVSVGGGVTCGEITFAAEKMGLFVPLGDRPGVGVGLIIAGGINHFMRKFGLAMDNIIRVVYLTPGGELLVADNEEHLMRFRGAGANFGVILSVDLRLYEIENIANQHVEYSFKEWRPSSNYLGRYSEYASELPVSVCIDAFVFFKKDKLRLATSRFHFGEKDKSLQTSDANLFHDLLCLDSTTTSDTTSHLLPSELYNRELYMTETFSVQSATSTKVLPENRKLRSVKRCLFFQTLQGYIEEEMIKSMESAPTKWSYIHILHGGGRVSWEFAAVITGRWLDGNKLLQDQTDEWVKLTTERLLPHAVGLYSTDLGPGDHKMRHHAYKQRDLIPLAELKRKHDPQMIFRHTCPLINPSVESPNSNDNPLGQSRGVVIIVFGKRYSGKDWIGNIIQTKLITLLGEHAKTHVNLVSISDGTKLAYANEMGVDGDLLLRSREFKEQHRDALLKFYERKKISDPAFDRRCFVEAIQQNTNDGILILTGLRDGYEYARLLSGRPVLFTLVKADDESKSRRGWNGFVEGVDDSKGESIENRIHPDLTYINNLDSTIAKASSWVMNELAPAIIKCSIREIPDVPKQGIVYKDIIGGLLIQPFGMALVSALITKYLESTSCNGCIGIDAVLAPEAVGFIFAGPIATTLCLPLLLARKVKPVFGTFCEAASNGSNMSNLTKSCENDGNKHKFFMVPGTIVPGQKVLVVDDCLATGATLEALAGMVTNQGGTVVKLVTLMEMVHPGLNGRQVALERGIDVFSLTKFQGM